MPTHPAAIHPIDLEHLRKLRPAHRRVHEEPLSLGGRVADRVAAGVGSWRFIIIQSSILALWIVANVLAWAYRWDPYPFILLNLVLSFQAAYTAPIIMMSQNRQADIDRRKAEQDYHVNLKAELEIELLHQKLDLLREQEIARLTKLIEELIAERRTNQG
ncbi:DUF1003 domain-containing protein [Azospirillum sp. TSO22-1]|uniref:DUF1003 domain-containing protein n=1 Tax=Azospirillum sp. TSO22-1 TaxID=716789 RepID=UPI000D608B60|nr:DUF1003 domain-containing protein [Azospirillum sp. TSO22-1]PWC52865.1 hypothetical protein TSO221_12655 [Azospirillum sp. TSO22-1]